MLGIVVMGLGCAAAGLMPANLLSLAIGAFFFIGFTNPIINGPFMALIQTRVAPEMQGRVLGLIQSGCTAMMPLGLVAAGPLADAIGVSAWLLGGGILCSALALGCFAVPAIMHLEDHSATPAVRL